MYPLELAAEMGFEDVVRLILKEAHDHDSVRYRNTIRDVSGK